MDAYPILMSILSLIKQGYFNLFPSRLNLKSRFDHYFFDLKYFLRPSASDVDFSILVKLTVDQINKISLMYYSFNFNDLIVRNQYEHILKELENPVNADLPIESVMKSTGFDSNIKFVDFINTNKNKFFKK